MTQSQPLWIHPVSEQRLLDECRRVLSRAAESLGEVEECHMHVPKILLDEKELPHCLSPWEGGVGACRLEEIASSAVSDRLSCQPDVNQSNTCGVGISRAEPSTAVKPRPGGWSGLFDNILGEA